MVTSPLKKFKVVRYARLVEHDALLDLAEELIEKLTVLPAKNNAEETQGKGAVDAGSAKDKDGNDAHYSPQEVLPGG